MFLQKVQEKKLKERSYNIIQNDKVNCVIFKKKEVLEGKLFWKILVKLKRKYKQKM